MKHYDYIICGAGCAGMSLAYRLSDPAFADKSILIIEKAEKKQNDRTFCHWSKKPGLYDPILHTKWSKVQYISDRLDKELDIAPYEYKMIRGEDFYKFNLEKILKTKHIEYVQAEINSVENSTNQAIVRTNNESYTADVVFKSFTTGKIDFKNDLHVIQHFKGWFVKTENPAFDAHKATFMDFSIAQNGETRFMYVLPWSSTEALVQLAIFSHALLSDEAYDKILTDYSSNNLALGKFEITEVEKGAIPMTTYDFHQHDEAHIVHIGTGAGIVKPSSGFAFRRVQQHSEAIINCIEKNIHPSKAQSVFKTKYKFFDKIFLNALLTDKASGQDVFNRMFDKLNPQLIFEFLDEETTFLQELKLFTAPPTLPFIKGFFEEILKK
jgi:lycopene beta-cyclase